MMNHRQWKKKYKKNHGYNPSMFDDRSKRDKVERFLRASRISAFAFECAESILSAKHLLSYSIHTHRWG